MSLLHETLTSRVAPRASAPHTPPVSDADPKPPVGRLAPSPTGLLHLGHARTFTLAWCHLRSRGGRVLLRIEDLDEGRVRPEFETALLRDLEWLGLDWDGPVDRQSDSRAHLDAALAELVRDGRAYPCVCTRKEIELAASAPHADDGTRRYPGTCRDRFSSLAEAESKTGRQAAWRFRVEPGEVSIEDGLAGRFTEDVHAACGDFPISRKGGAPAYQLAVCVDDARQGVTEVHRGDDLLSSTPRQALLMEALGLARPRWFHFPLVVDAGGRRLAKRHDDLSLRALRDAGVSPEALRTWIAESAGQPSLEPERFDLALVPPRPVVLSEALLQRWLA